MDDPAQFGLCCTDFREAMDATIVPERFFFVQSGVLYLSIGYANTERGTAFYDMAVIHCPFCGAQLQTKEAIKAKAGVR
jgi:hypothetical protein